MQLVFHKHMCRLHIWHTQYIYTVYQRTRDPSQCQNSIGRLSHRGAMKPAVLAFAMMPRICGGDPSTGRRVGRNGGWKITLDYIIMIYRYIDIDIDIYIYIFKYRYRYRYIYIAWYNWAARREWTCKRHVKFRVASCTQLCSRCSGICASLQLVLLRPTRTKRPSLDSSRVIFRSQTPIFSGIQAFNIRKKYSWSFRNVSIQPERLTV